jgi:hypothetical protein
MGKVESNQIEEREIINSNLPSGTVTFLGTEFNTLWAEGRAMTMEQAKELALYSESIMRG